MKMEYILNLIVLLVVNLCCFVACLLSPLLLESLFLLDLTIDLLPIGSKVVKLIDLLSLGTIVCF